VPQQTEVFVDLLPGYEGVLVIDGLELQTINLDDLQAQPGRELVLPPTTIYEKGNATLTFNPSEDSTISEFSQGEHLVKVIYWKTTDGRSRARSYSWTFTVVYGRLQRASAVSLGLGSSPVASTCSKPASSRIGTPSSCALVSLLAPGRHRPPPRRSSR
jgi:hypothetical protein